MKYILLTQGKQAVVDDADFGKLTEHKWYVNSSKDGRNYASTEIDGKHILMHRFILKTPVGKSTDHINGDPLDNRRENLRICTQSQNLANARIKKENTSGYRGVHFKKAKKAWIAQLNFNKKRVLYRQFKNKEDAIKAYQEAAKQCFGEFRKVGTI